VQTKKPKLKFKINVDPQELEGIEVIWTMYQHTDLSEKTVRDKGMKFLSNIYLSTTATGLKKGEIYHSFVKEIFSRLNEMSGSEESLQSGKRNSLVENMLQILNTFFVASEKTGTVGLRKHKSMEAPSYGIKRILVQ
jgi:hypothetical protein